MSTSPEVAIVRAFDYKKPRLKFAWFSSLKERGTKFSKTFTTAHKS